MTNMINELLKKQKEELENKRKVLGTVGDFIGYEVRGEPLRNWFETCQQELLEAKDREMREIIESNHKKEVKEIQMSDNQEKTKSYLLAGIEVYKESLINQLNNYEH